MELLLFKDLEESQEDRLLREFAELRDQCERVRKAQFARISHLNKLYTETKHELDTLKLAMVRCGKEPRKREQMQIDWFDTQIVLSK